MYGSSILGLRAKGSPYLPFSDHPHYPFADRISRCGVHSSSSSSSSCCCSCCCCCFACYGRSCGFAHRLPVTVSQLSLYGLRQSSLLQLSASRRLILGGGGDRLYCRVPSCGVGQDGYETSCVVNERRGEVRVGGRRKKVVQCMVSEESSGIWQSSRFEDAEAVLSLLSDEVDAELFSGSVKKGASMSKRFDIDKKKKKKKTTSAESSKGMKRNLRSDLAERDSRHELESVVTESIKDCRLCRMKRDKEPRKEAAKMKKETSSVSSYHSVLSLGDFDSDPEKIKDDLSRRNSSVAYREDYPVREQNRMRKEEELKRNGMVVEGSETSRHKESTSRNYAEWDWRKKSEKKLDEASIEETRSRKESSQVQHRISRTHEQDDHQKASTSRRQFTGVDEKLDVSVKVDSGGRNSYNQTENVIIGAEKSADVCRVCGSDVTLSSQSREQLGVRKENVAASADFVVHDTDDSRRARRRYPQQVSGGVKIEEIDSETAAELQRVSDKTKISDRQENRSYASTSAQKIRQEKNSKSDEQMITQSDARRSQKLVELSESHENIERPYITTRQHREENTNLVSSSVSGRREQYSQTAQEETYRTKHSRDESTELTSKLSRQTKEGETALSSQRTSEKKTADGSNNITVVVNVGDRVGRGRGESSQMAMQTGSQNEGRMHGKVLSSPANVPRLIPLAENQAGEDKGSLALRSTAHPPKEQASAYMGQTSRTEFQESKFSGVISPELKPEVESGGGRDDIYGTPINLPAHDDVLESVHHSDLLYSQVLGEFIEKARHEVLSSEIQTKTADTQLIDTRQEQIEASSGQYGSFVQIKSAGSSSSSQGSGTKGPSDEIWLEREASAQEPLKVEEEPPEGTGGSGQAIVRRTGRSLWNIIGDVVRLRWSSRSQTPHSAHGSRRKTSSNESVSSEAWFSGHEQGSTPIETIATSPKIQSTGASVKSLAESSPRDKYRLLEESGSSPLTSESSSASKAASSAYIQEGSGLNEGVMQLESSDTPASIDLVKPSASRVALEAEVETGAVGLSIGGSSERMEVPVSKLMMVSGTGGEDGLMKQRKFQRTGQVPRDRFDEWEEAYQVESEQRRIDEMFMREALTEAKKAADKWEVPVGAVLVQEGKIIARGCNLVEELRDSTAHAEMICIREASNALRSWRLANTTLYVTLEPCPMCAGAILQARIDTLVWGAPNKLLGADGSWIRLFPTGDESGSSETIEKPPPPVHPFHPNMKIRRAVLASECADTMQHFFQLRRRKKETKPKEPPTRPSRLHVATHPSKLLNKLLHITFCS